MSWDCSPVETLGGRTASWRPSFQYILDLWMSDIFDLHQGDGPAPGGGLLNLGRRGIA